MRDDVNTMNATIRREFRVAFSRHAQPVWFRLVKWMCILIGVALFHGQRWFWWTLAGLAMAGMVMHLIYRWKTKIWTRAWGGWNDLPAGRD
jgi:uncharacterized membrane protein YedE/YeeE